MKQTSDVTQSKRRTDATCTTSVPRPHPGAATIVPRSTVAHTMHPGVSSLVVAVAVAVAVGAVAARVGVAGVGVAGVGVAGAGPGVGRRNTTSGYRRSAVSGPTARRERGEVGRVEGRAR